MRKRPLGITILAIFSLLGGILSFLLTLLLVLLGGVGLLTGILPIALIGGLGAFFGFIMTAFNFLKFWGLWKMRKWGWYLVVILTIIGIFITLIFMGIKFSWFSLLGMFWDGIVIVYLWTKRRKFGV